MAGNGVGAVSESRQLERFGQVARAARDNLGAVIDLVLVHNEKPVRGRQPRASLNRAIVVAAVGAWERFITDTSHAFKHDHNDPRWGPGSDSAGRGQHYARPAADQLSKGGMTDGTFLPRLHVSAATNWSGVRMRAMEELKGEAPGRLSGLTFTQHLQQWVTLRNALAHGSIRQLMGWVDDPGHWGDQDPYASELHGRYRLWESDATGGEPRRDEPQMAGTTVQSGCARGCLALIVQTVDWLIVDIGQAHGRGWDVEGLRLPETWFGRELPPAFRGARADRYAHWTLWGGPELHRRSSS